ncbi:PD-(D/E)XK nuclease family protein [Pseudomonas sp. TH32]|uniref:PD-(D/E)XK nuclease family protein n=1 Tax=unclassified Pseudomonas TaxID=196821 RepID=UPI001912C5CF|nr:MULTISPECIES: PD-(D/E)XK nuclease family protein [unclassified Pseudomonas]MBK5439935.1 PD-(D/E)XK nuclease family protein [Pseudomonas sp. TH32]MDF3202731.1 PD-(D/E)XK nuclease family protein [Pseudomonas sp. 1912-s]
MSDAVRFNQIIETWRQQKDFQDLLPYNQYRHWLDYQRLHEHNFQNMLFWLLNPREGHQLGDFFVRALLDALPAFSPANKTALEGWIEEESWIAPETLQAMNLHSLCVATEAGRIDLVLVDPVNRFVIAIERKDQHVLTKDQLKRHTDWIEEHYGQHYYWLGVVCDSRHQLRQQPFTDSNWLHIDDQWLITALDQAVSRAQPHVQDQLLNIRSRLGLIESWENDPVFVALKPKLAEFAATHSGLIDELLSLKLTAPEVPLVGIDAQWAVKHLLPALAKSNAEDEQVKAVLHAVEHFELLYALRDLHKRRPAR